MPIPRKGPFKGKGAESRAARTEATATILHLRQQNLEQFTDPAPGYGRPVREPAHRLGQASIPDQR